MFGFIWFGLGLLSVVCFTTLMISHGNSLSLLEVFILLLLIPFGLFSIIFFIAAIIEANGSAEWWYDAGEYIEDRVIGMLGWFDDIKIYKGRNK